MGLLPVIARRAVWKRLSWARVWAVGVWLAKQGRDRLQQNLSAAERRELLDVMRKSKGRPSNLGTKEQARFRHLVRKAATGRK